jgi:hypothetical protein
MHPARIGVTPVRVFLLRDASASQGIKRETHFFLFDLSADFFSVSPPFVSVVAVVDEALRPVI